MTILVDPMYPHKSGEWCHMMSDQPSDEGLAELHAMVARLGLRRSWFQDKNPRFPHYDLRRSKRDLALRYGAKAVSSREMVMRCWKPLIIEATP